MLGRAAMGSRMTVDFGPSGFAMMIPLCGKSTCGTAGAKGRRRGNVHAVEKVLVEGKNAWWHAAKNVLDACTSGGGPGSFPQTTGCRSGDCGFESRRHRQQK